MLPKIVTLLGLLLLGAPQKVNAAPVPLHRVSPAGELAVHYYFHQSPESPDGTRVIYTLWPAAPPGMALSKAWFNNRPAQVWIADRDGSNRQQVGQVGSALSHTGACAIWLDDQTVAFRDRRDLSVHVVSLDGGPAKKWTGDISDFSPARREILFAADGPQPNAPQLRNAVYALNVDTGALRELLLVEALQEFAPALQHPFDAKTWKFQHPYWSPSTRRIAVRVSAGDDAFVFWANDDGSRPVNFGRKPMHWTFWDDDSFFGHDVISAKDQQMKRWDLGGNLLETLAGQGNHGTVSPDKQWIATDSWYGSDPTQLLLYQRGQTTPRAILATQKPTWEWQIHMHPAWSRDGKRIYFNYRPPEGALGEVYYADVSEMVEAQSKPATPATTEDKMQKGELLYSDDFQTLDDWRIEAENRGEVRARNGALEIDSAEGVTAWFATPLQGDVLIEYEATVVDNGGPNDRVSDLNSFWMASDPLALDDFWQRASWRGGDFKNYQSLQLYYVGYGGHDNTKTRFRRYNGQPNPPIVAELSEAAHLIRPNHTYKIQLVRAGNSAQFWRDGEKLFDFSDPAPLQSGFFGFRTVRNHVRFANFRVYRLQTPSTKK